MNLQDKACEVLRLLGELNELEKTVSRLRNELIEDWHRIDDALDENSLRENPVVKEMNDGHSS